MLRSVPVQDIQLVAFDLDDTLAPSKSPVDPRMATLLADLLTTVPVCIISGGRYEQFEQQVLRNLDPAADLSDLHLMPTCGTQYFTHDAGSWTQVYAEPLSDAEKQDIIAVLEAGVAELELAEAETWGPTIEDRGSQITFSALGQQAPVAAKVQWDPSGVKREGLRAYAAERLPGLEVRGGGSTSVDITRKGIDKAYGMSKLIERLGLEPDRVLFVGDRLDPGGNDFPVKSVGVRTIAVEDWLGTSVVISGLIAIRTGRVAAG
jgi:phosphomannomutase